MCLRSEDSDTGVWSLQRTMSFHGYVFSNYSIYILQCSHIGSSSDLYNCEVGLVGIVIPCLRKLRLRVKLEIGRSNT